MTDRTLTAMYDTRGAAEAARDGLVGLGVPSANINIRGTESGGSTATGSSAPTQEKGFWESLGDLFAPDEDRYTYEEGIRRGGYLLTARVPEGMEESAINVLELSEPIDLNERSESWRQSGWTGYQAGSTGSAGAATGGAYATGAGLAEAGTAGYATTRERDVGLSTRAGEEDTIQVAEEQVRVGKREVGRGGVRVRSYVTERPVEEQVNLREERVQVERRPVDRPVEPGDTAFKERTIEATERGEEAVVSKEARVVEEIGLRKDVDTRTETVRDTVRKQEVEIEDERTAGGSVAGQRTTTDPSRRV